MIGIVSMINMITIMSNVNTTDILPILTIIVTASIVYAILIIDTINGHKKHNHTPPKPGQCLVPFGVGGSRVPQAESTSVDARHLYRVASGDGRHWPDRAVCSASLRGGSGRTLIRDQICPNSIGQFQGALEIDTACGSLFSPGIPWTLHLKIDSGPGQSPRTLSSRGPGTPLDPSSIPEKILVPGIAARFFSSISDPRGTLGNPWTVEFSSGTRFHRLISTQPSTKG